MVGPPLLASVVSSTVLMSRVPTPELPTLLPLTPLVMPPEVAASPMRLLLAVSIGPSMSSGVVPVPRKLPATIVLLSVSVPHATDAPARFRQSARLPETVQLVRFGVPRLKCRRRLICEVAVTVLLVSVIGPKLKMPPPTAAGGVESHGAVGDGTVPPLLYIPPPPSPLLELPETVLLVSVSVPPLFGYQRRCRRQSCWRRCCW